ncbi:MAG TPA: glycosyltransferase [Anaerolineae bacterium]|nr:glycosyltransferase [Anaerolineae bacterium]
MRILFVTPYIPSLIRVRPYNLIRALAAIGYPVHLVALRPPEDRCAPIDDLRAACTRVDVFPLSRARTLWNALRALPAALPLQAAYSHHPQVERYLQDLAKTGQYAVVHVEHLRGAVLVDRVRGIPRVFDSVDSIAYLFEQTSRQAARLRQRLMARLDLARTRRFEARAPFQFDRTLVTSPADAHAFERMADTHLDGRLTILPNGVDLDYFHPADTPREPATVLFSGKMSYHANAAAALYLAREIMPRLWQRCAEARLLIVGKDPPPSVQELSPDPRIEVTGYVSDVRPFFARATVAIAPLLYGAGIQNKVLEAMACGVPVIATPQVCGALKTQAGRDILIGQDADQLTSAALDVINDPAYQNTIARAARQYVERYHRWGDIAHDLVNVYQCLSNPPIR